MSIQILNPLVDRRWDEIAERHPKASAFHQRGWLEALAQTYGYEPLVLTSTPAGQPLRNGLVFCRVSSWITGTRLVSLPFADHCEPLLDDPRDLVEFADWLRTETGKQHWKYVEIRPLSPTEQCGRLSPSASYCFHELDLKPTVEEIFHRFHKASIQRRIRRAEKAGLAYEAGRSERLLSEFYRLMMMTRRRHRLLPQPRAWFRNLVACMADKLQIRVVRKDGAPIAAILSLRHGSSFIYKYGCSNERFHNFGAMPFLFWKLIEESKAAGGEKVDFGRSDLDQKSLITFKDKLGTTKRELKYYRYSGAEQNKAATVKWMPEALTQLFSCLPDSVSCTAGELLYRHMG